MHDVIIVGSGPSGTSAALQLVERGITPLILDVGMRPSAPGMREPRINLYEYKRRHDSFALTIGSECRRLRALTADPALPAKLLAPKMAFVTEAAERYSPTDTRGFHAVQSFAAGGLANAWGAGLYRFTDEDLEGFPIREPELAPYFDRLTQTIGIGGADDDLSPFLGSPAYLREPPRLSRNASWLRRRYESRKRRLNRTGIFLGRPRLAVLTSPFDGRTACDYGNLEFWEPGLPYLYTPTMTLDTLRAHGAVAYEGSRQVLSYAERDEGIVVRAKDLVTDRPVEYRARALLLAAGAIGSAKIALAARSDHSTALPLLDNPAVQLPLVVPSAVGRRLEEDAFGLTQLNLVWNRPPLPRAQGSILELTGPLRSEFFSRFPLGATANLALIRYILPAMLVMQLYFPSDAQPAARLSLGADGTLRIDGPGNAISWASLRALFAGLRRLGVIAHSAMSVRVPTGHAIHYAGTLPMRQTPAGPYECDPQGRLRETRGVYVVDGAGFPTLPAKNASFALMANAMRIADGVASRLEAEPWTRS